MSLDEIARRGRRAQADGAVLVRRPRTTSSTRCSPSPPPNSWSSSTPRCGRRRMIRSIGSTPWCGRCSVRRSADRRCSAWSARSAGWSPTQATGCGSGCSRSSTAPSTTSRAEMDAGRLRRGDPRLDRGARLRHGHRHRHRTRGAPSRRLVGRRRPACATSATNSEPSSAPPSRPDHAAMSERPDCRPLRSSIGGCTAP